MKVSLVVTVLNEEKTIQLLLDSINKQTQNPDEIVIVDGGSTDKTIEIIHEYKAQAPCFRQGKKFCYYILNGSNRAEGRNFGVSKATGDIIIFTDAGCELHKNWVREIIKPFKDSTVDVVAGYYSAKTKNTFEKCVVPFVLVMPDRVNPKTFLPASRSMAIRKDLFQKVRGFPEEFSDNEDFVFANKIKNYKRVFAKEATVYWYPRENLKDFWNMIFRFAKGDAFAGLRKLKVLTVFLRYIIFINFPEIFLIYIFWSILKNYKYVNKIGAFIWLPVLQIVSDFAVMLGTIKGIWQKDN